MTKLAIAAKALPQKAMNFDDIIDLLFDIFDLFDLILDVMRNLGEYLSGN